MIPKANQRAGGQQLATHLLNEFDNERVELFEIRGSIATDLHGAFSEWQAASETTKCKKYLYSLSLNPDHRQKPFTRADYLEFIARVEKTLALSHQPRAIVFHNKQDREHCHVVWSRIDTERGCAVQISHDRPKLMAAVRDFARELGLTLPLAMQGPLKDRFNDRAQRTNLAEQQQQERSGISKAERRRAITEAWRSSQNAETFIAALEKQGYILAQGDARAYVVIDRAGEVHSLARQIEGVRTKDIKILLGSLPPTSLISVAKAQQIIRTAIQKQLSRAFALEASARWMRLRESQQKRRGTLDRQRQALQARHIKEKQRLKDRHAAKEAALAQRRAAFKTRTLVRLAARFTPLWKLVEKRYRQQDLARVLRQRKQRAALTQRHKREVQDMTRKARALTSIEKREARSLRTRIKREQFRGILREPTIERHTDLTPSQRLKLQEFIRAGKDISRAPEPDRSSETTKPPPHLTKEQAAKLEQIKDASRDISKSSDAGPAPKSPEPERTSFPGRLAQAIRQRAAQKDKTKDKDRSRDR